MEMEKILLLLNLAEKLRGLPALANLLQLVTTEIAQIEAQAKDEIALQAEAAKKEAAAAQEEVQKAQFAEAAKRGEEEAKTVKQEEATNERRA